VPHHGRSLVELVDDLAVVVGQLSDGLSGEDLGVLIRLLDGLGIVRQLGVSAV
jgi:hypothetical protein